MEKGPRVTIENGVFIKVGDPAMMSIEFEKTSRAREIAVCSGIFEVPQILDYDAKRGKITFEFINDIHRLRDAVSSEHIARPLMQKIGKALAIIHKNLTLPGDMVLPLPQEYAMSGDEAFVHGDFSPGNICIGSEGKRIVILDWQATARLGTAATYGSRYFDLTWLIYDLFYRPINRPRYRMAVAAKPLAEEFLAGYGEISEFGNYNGLQGYMRQFLRYKISARKSGGRWKRRLLLVPSHIRLWRFIHSLGDNHIGRGD